MLEGVAVMKYITPILLAFVLVGSGCRRNRSDSQRQAASSAAPPPSIGQPTAAIPDKTNNATVEPDPSTAAPVAAADSVAAPAKSAPSAAAAKAKRSTRSKSTGPVRVKVDTPGGTKARREGRVYEDPQRIHAGMSYSEMIRRFGPPSLQATTVPGRTLLSYLTRKYHVQVAVEDRQVTSVVAWVESE